MIKIVQCDLLDESFLGKDLTIPLIEEIKAAGADVCGENGEYHTFVYNGPIFKFPIPLEIRGIVDFSSHRAIDVVLPEPFRG
jgi:diphthamide synthase (EF-2-diphthine--ammonia ligase)